MAAALHCTAPLCATERCAAASARSLLPVSAFRLRNRPGRGVPELFKQLLAILLTLLLAFSIQARAAGLPRPSAGAAVSSLLLPALPAACFRAILEGFSCCTLLLRSKRYRFVPRTGRPLSRAPYSSYPVASLCWRRRISTRNLFRASMTGNVGENIGPSPPRAFHPARGDEG